MLLKLAKSNNRWKLYSVLYWALIIISITVLSSMSIAIFVNLPKEKVLFTVFIFTMLIFILSIIPFLCAMAVRNTAKIKCAEPFSLRTQETMCLKEDVMEYSFYNATKHEAAAYSKKWATVDIEDLTIISIKYEAITDIKLIGDICRISGTVKYFPSKNEIVYEKKHRKTYKGYEILMDYDSETKDEIIRIINDKVKEKNHG